MNVRIFWARAMECMCAQTRPRCILSSEKVWGNEVRTHVNSKGKSPSTGNFLPRGGSNPRRCIKQDSEPDALPTELFRPLGIASKGCTYLFWSLEWRRINKASFSRNRIFRLTSEMSETKYVGRRAEHQSNNNNNNNNLIQRLNSRSFGGLFYFIIIIIYLFIYFFYNLLSASRTVSNRYAQVAQVQSCVDHVQHIERLSRATCQVTRSTKGQLSY